MSLPQLSPSDLDYAYVIIQQLYVGNIEQQQQVQRQLHELQQREEAWGLIAPFLQHEDLNVQFFGAHTAQVKISRDWATFPDGQAETLRDTLLDLTARLAVLNRGKIVLRKLYVALTSLALKLCPTSPNRWPGWLLFTTNFFADKGVSNEHLLDFLSIVVEEIKRSDLLGPSRLPIDVSVREAVPIVIQVITSTLSAHIQPLDETQYTGEKIAALKCLESWVQWGLPANQVVPLIPLLITLLSHPDLFAASSNALQEIMSVGSLSRGSSTKTLTEPLLVWIEAKGHLILDKAFADPDTEDISHSFCKLLVTLGDHSITYIATHLQSSAVQTFLRVFLGYAGYPGFYGVDETESEMTISFWTYLEEALMDSDFLPDTGGEQMAIANQVFLEVIRVLQIKSRWPDSDSLRGWTKDQKDAFVSYRRDVGEAIINAYYILRDEALRALVDPLEQNLSKTPVIWEDVEAGLHCIKSAQEAVPPTDNNLYLSRIFGPAVLGRIPTTGDHQVRRTTLSLIGEYSTWFASQDITLLLSAVSYIVVALEEPPLSLSAASALKSICDANRKQLAPHISSFAELHAASINLPEDERVKIIESISSVIQALPPDQSIAPVEAILVPVVVVLGNALNAADEGSMAKAVACQQIKVIAACSKGLALTYDAFSPDLFLDEQESEERLASTARGRAAPQIVKLRTLIMTEIRRTMELWSTDPEIADALSDLLKTITSLPSDASLISLPPGPILELVCAAAEQHLTAVWLSLASRLLTQLNPPSHHSLKDGPPEESQRLVDIATRSLVLSSLHALGASGAMVENPDLVQAFFACLDQIVASFLHALLVLPPDVFAGIMRCCSQALALQERYSLVGCCKFLTMFVKQAMSQDATADATRLLLRPYGGSIINGLIFGIAGVAPRSAVPNLAEVLSTLVAKVPEECKAWVQSTMTSTHIAANDRITQTVKTQFISTVLGSRSTKKTAMAAHELALAARGLNGSSYANNNAYASSGVL